MDTRRGTCTTSPEFEFWMLRNPSFPQPNILSADELFVDGVLLPLHLLRTSTKPDPLLKPDPETHASAPGSEPSSVTTTTASKRWRDIFRKSNKKNAEDNNEKKAKKKEKKGGTGGGAAAASAAELNINIWPFSRSRSAGNAGTRPRLFPGAPAARKVNSAPCSRSNSAGEYKSRKWPSSPGRVGVHLGRSSPVWQVRRGASASKHAESLPLNPEKSKRETPTTSRRSKLGSSGADTRAKVLNVSVPICTGHRHNNLSCRSDDNSGGSGFPGSNRGHGYGDVGGKIFNLRSFFTKKTFVTSH